MTTDHEEKKRRNAYQTGYLKLNYFKAKGYGIIQPDDGGAEVFCHIKNFYSFGSGISQEAIYNLEYRRRLHFRMAIDPRSDRTVAMDVTPIREIQAPDGTVLELPLRGNRSRQQAEERATNKAEGFGSLVAALR
jgi:cold shock CspA family protein